MAMDKIKAKMVALREEADANAARADELTLKLKEAEGRASAVCAFLEERQCSLAFGGAREGEGKERGRRFLSRVSHRPWPSYLPCGRC
jgi:hypothetical protein